MEKGLKLPPLSPRKTAATHGLSVKRNQRSYPARVHVHSAPNPTLKSQWQIRIMEQPDTLVLGTSNISRITKKPRQDIELHSYPGGRLAHMQEMLHAAPVHTETFPRRVIIAMGINDANRGRFPKPLISQQLSRVAQLAKARFPNARVYMAQTNYSAKLAEQAAENTRSINRLVTQLQGVRYLSHIPVGQVEIETRDKMGVHWSADTANQIVNHWVRNLN